MQCCAKEKNSFFLVDMILGTDDEEDESADIAEWAALGLIFALVVLSIADAWTRITPGFRSRSGWLCRQTTKACCRHA